MQIKKWALLMGFFMLTITACQPGLAGSPLSTPQAVGASPLPTTTPLQPVLSGRIAFNSDRTGVYQIYVYDVENGELTQLTETASRSVEPSWSPDGQRIAFSTAGPSGRGLELYVMNADGSNPQPLTADGAFAVGADWCPDGTRIAFHSNRTGDFEVYVINSDGSGMTNLTSNPSADFMPNWSPDGQSIVFVSTRAGAFNLFRMNADGTDVQQLTTGTSDSYYPRWSPDGQYILFTRQDPDSVERIYIMPAEGAEPEPLTGLDSNNSGATWAANGQTILFASDRTGEWRLYTMLPDGRNQFVLPPQANGRNPDWTP